MADAGAPLPGFLGWRMVFAGFVAQLVYTAMGFGAFGVFVTPLEREFGASRAEISAAGGIALVVMTGLAPVLGRRLDRGSLRRIMLAGLAIAGAGAALLAEAASAWQAGLAFCALVALGTALFGPLPSMTLVANWFVHRRGIALGITVAGATIGGAVAPVVAAFLIDALGWRHALLGLGLGSVAIAAPVFALVIVGRPSEVGQFPDGLAAPASTTAGAAGAPRPYQTLELLRDRRFLLLGFALALIYTSPLVSTLHLVPFAEGMGFARQDAAFVLTPVAICSLLGKLAFGAVSDRIDPRQALRFAVVLLVAGWLLLLASPTYRQVLVAGVLLGLGIGAVAPLQGVLVGRYFRREAFGQVVGLGALLTLPILAGASPVAGWLYDATGSYRAGFALEVGCLVAAGLLITALGAAAPGALSNSAGSRALGATTEGEMG
jgi:MFS family permease